MASGTAWIKFRVWRLTEVVFRGKPAWFVSPWLVALAVIAAELGWMALGQLIWYRNRARRNFPPEVAPVEDQRPP